MKILLLGLITIFLSCASVQNPRFVLDLTEAKFPVMLTKVDQPTGLNFTLKSGYSITTTYTSLGNAQKMRSDYEKSLGGSIGGQVKSMVLVPIPPFFQAKELCFANILNDDSIVESAQRYFSLNLVLGQPLKLGKNE